ncbi:Tetratricopeptide repeat-containing protein [Aquimarina amphilecti]|uniref:Tetratricopeptide repeat-containing protein n=1 Tax=Aquimarina amphilecti TaxID=1038014 RepID=A0A1H7N0J5_AQUAM|nr:tetratricopeptide repeat protein [Aquimarina amphilecti]SEL17010.1 Tetratricopeptide repeat-containing protein [Aquimarina amphilecti]
MNRQRLILLISLFCTHFFFSQEQERKEEIRRIEQEIENATSDSIRLNLKEKLANRLAFFDRAIAQEIFTEIEKAIKNKGYTSPYYLELRARTLYSLSSTSSNLGNYAQSLEYANQAYELAKSIQYNRIAGKSISSMGAVYHRQNELEKAKLHYKRALVIQEKDTTTKGQVISLSRLGAVYAKEEKYDSARYYFKKCAVLDTIKTNVIRMKANIGNTYANEKRNDIAVKIFEENLKILKNTDEYPHIANNHLSMATSYHELEEYYKATVHIDNAIFYAKKVNDHLLLKYSYEEKAEIDFKAERYKDSREAYLTYSKYKDSLVDENRARRFSELEYAYQFKNEKKLAAIELANAKTKKQLYFILFFVVLLLALASIYFIIRRNQQKIVLAKNKLELKEMEKLKADLALSNRENELKKVVIENSITEEVLNKTLGDIKEIITFQNETERQVALRSLSADLLSEKSSQKSTSNIKTYVDKVHMDFKIYLDANYPKLTPKDKELIYLMKAGLSSSQISKVLSTTLPAIRSNRYRLRKKLNLASNEDIIVFLDQKNSSQE